MNKNVSIDKILDISKILVKLKKTKDLKLIKAFIGEFYSVEEMPDDFYILFLNKVQNEQFRTLFNVIIKNDIYLLISYLKYSDEFTLGVENTITPLQYYTISKKHINLIVERLNKLEVGNNTLDQVIKNEPEWLLRKTENEFDVTNIAYKMYVSIGLDNSLELLEKKFGDINYNQIYYLFSKLNVKNVINDIKNQSFIDFLFKNKKDQNNIMRQILNGEFKELFLKFDYFYNNFDYFVSKLGEKLPKEKLKCLLSEKYVTKYPMFPEITGDISKDMLASYYCRYEYLDVSEDEIYEKNLEIYDKFLKNRYRSSIPRIKVQKDKIVCEVIKLSDPRNLVLGYRSGNCFRFNGEARALFHNFLENEHMRLVSVSTTDNKDYAMMLVMRNGNVLLGQGIEVSDRVSIDEKGKDLYEVCKELLKQMMEYMNSNGDEIVATVMGRTNAHVSNYNSQILPFLVKPILSNENNYYNGIDNYQCLLDIEKDKSLNDIKLYIPTTRYYDEREPILRRTYKTKVVNEEYKEIENRLRSLRFLRMKNNGVAFYNSLMTKEEKYTSCNKDWYIIVYNDNTIDSFILENDERARAEYEEELENLKQKLLISNKCK